MEAIPFPGCNRNFGSPGFYDLPVITDGVQCVSKWKMTRAELEILQKTGEIWLAVRSGDTQPPVAISVHPLVQYNDPP